MLRPLLLLALLAALASGSAIAVPTQGFFTPANNNVTPATNSILEFNALTGQFVGTVATPQGGGQINGMTYGPDGNLYAAYWNVDTNAPRSILKITPDGTTTTFVATDSGGLQIPLGLTFGADGNLYVASNGGVLSYDGTTGAFLDNFASTGLSASQDLLFGTDGRLYVSNGGSDSISRYDGQTGAFLGYLAAPGAFGLDAPVGMAMDPAGDLYVTSFPTNRIFRFSTATGSLVSIFDLPGMVDGLDTLLDLAFGPGQSLYASVRREVGGTDFLKLNAETGEILGVFAQLDSRKHFNTGMLFVDVGCASLGAAAGQASNCFVPTQVPEPGTLALVLAGCSGIVALRRRRPHSPPNRHWVSSSLL